MDAVAEREVMAELAVDVEAVGVGEAPLVAVGRARRGSSMALPAGTVWPWCSTSRSRSGPRAGAGGSKRRTSSTAFGMSSRILDELAALVGMLGEHLARPADQLVVVSLPAAANTLT